MLRAWPYILYQWSWVFGLESFFHDMGGGGEVKYIQKFFLYMLGGDGPCQEKQENLQYENTPK